MWQLTLAASPGQARSSVGTRKFHEIWRKVIEHSGHPFPEITITYEDLCVEANALVGAGAINSITNSIKGVRRPHTHRPPPPSPRRGVTPTQAGSAATLLLQVVETCIPRQRERVHLLSKTSGVIKPVDPAALRIAHPPSRGEPLREQ